MSGLGVSDAELFRRAFASLLGECFTNEAVIVHEYYPETKTVDLEFASQRTLPNEDGELGHETLPIIPNIPVLFLGAGSTLLVFPIAKGTQGALFCASTAFNAFRETGRVSPPGFLPRLALGLGGFFLPAFLSKAGTPGAGTSTAAETAQSDETVIFEFAKLSLGSKDATDWVALASKTDARLDALEDFAANHTHDVAIPAGTAASTATSAPAVDPPSGDSVASTKVKIDE